MTSRPNKMSPDAAEYPVEIYPAGTGLYLAELETENMRMKAKLQKYEQDALELLHELQTLNAMLSGNNNNPGGVH